MKFLRLIPWIWFPACFVIAAACLILIIRSGTQPIDYQGYQRAVDALNRGAGPYQSPEACQKIWKGIHKAEVFVITGGKLDALPPPQPGPYLYPPTLALLLQRLHIGASLFTCLLLGAVLGFGWLWLRATGASPWWLLLISGSWDVLATFLTGNAELLLLFLTLAAAWLLWKQRGAWAAPLIALAILIKPFYAMFFVTFGLLLLLTDAPQRRSNFRVLALAAGIALLLAILDIATWGSVARAAAMDYFRHAMDYQWWTFPIAEQTPMSLWNRSPMQGLALLGLSANAAQLTSHLLWLALLAITLWHCRGKRLGFAMLFALAFVLLYIGRPVGWGFVYLDIVLLVALRPVLRPAALALILTATIALMLSHWWSLILTGRGIWLNFFTMQTAHLPWETFTILPACWLLLILFGCRSDEPAEARS
ncbi:MAG: glycosyltransferase 87 family protein [Kiritimatiellaeota bacterium]|nr:glycosyltransferase 87 family protein [Kiritimatiellota bacterium]